MDIPFTFELNWVFDGVDKTVVLTIAVHSTYSEPSVVGKWQVQRS